MSMETPFNFAMPMPTTVGDARRFLLHLSTHTYQSEGDSFNDWPQDDDRFNILLHEPCEPCYYGNVAYLSGELTPHGLRMLREAILLVVK